MATEAQHAVYLLVDDEVDFVTTLAERLEMRGVGPVEVVHDGETALAFVRSRPPRVAVVDLRMPGIGGMAVLQQVKQKHPQVEVIICTGHGSQKEEQKALELGAYAYLQKPVDVEKLAATMLRAGSRAAREAAAVNLAERGDVG